MHYIFVTLLLFALLLVYFKIADKYNIIDKPNHRSAHTEITLRGGGVIFPIAFLLYAASYFFRENSILSPQNYLIFGIGLLAICTISFIDDILDLSSKIRLVFHFLSVSLLLYFINAFQLLPIWAIPFLYILIIGILNAYNFMDGINGITGLYSMVILGSLLYVNQYVIEFTDINFIIYPLIACLVFLFFNFRKKAKCFMGDIGSMGIAFWVLGLLGLLIIKTQELKYLLFLTVYGVEVVLTILQRLKSKENIFEAHRRHLYQLFSNEKKISHLIVSSVYAFLQLLINITVILLDLPIWIIFVVIIIPSLILYIITKAKIEKQIKVINNN
jgi:UDP-N-acetylmuramyl pentapeptide phosphotransferase/UDP-N-acetylglucosamine-1-phosphate transferase